MDKLIQWLGSDFAPKVAKFMDKSYHQNEC